MRRRKSQARHKARLQRTRDKAKAVQPKSPAKRFVVAADLVDAIVSLGLKHAIVWSSEVREYFSANGLLTGERREDPTVPWNGAHFERADHEACRSGELQKWKRGRTVGWSRSGARDEAAYARASASALSEGAVRLDYVGGRWRTMRFDAATGRWTE